MPTWYKRLLGWWRLHLGFCPECNSDAPAIDKCLVCFSYRGTYPPSETVKRRWRERFAARNARRGVKP
jgi:hypothetical protein